MKRLLIFVMVLCVVLWLGVGAQEDEVEPAPVETEEEVIEPEVAVPTVKPVTRLDVNLIDEMDDQFIKLENCMVRLVGELPIAGFSHNYSKTFLNGDRYSITIWIKLKK